MSERAYDWQLIVIPVMQLVFFINISWNVKT